MSEKGVNEERSLNLIDFILIVLKWKRFILITTGIIGLISIILYFFVFNLIYLSTATIKSTGKSGSIFSALEGLSNFGSFEDLTSSARSQELAVYREILSSRRCLEALIVKFDLMKNGDYQYVEDAVKSFQKNQLFLDDDRISGLLYIGVYDKDPVIAKDMTEFLISELDKINIELNVTKAKSNREFVEKRYFQAKEDLSASEDSLKSFQMIYGVAPDLQIKAAAQSAFTLEADLKTEEVKLDVLKKILSPEQLEIRTQEAKINSLKDKITEIQNSTNLSDFLRLGNSPQIVMSFLRLQRNVEIQTKILTYLLPVYEQAKIEEKKETPTILVLDKPYVAERKTKPKRLTMVLLSIFGSFFVLSICTIIYETTFKNFIRAFKERK